MYLTDFSINCSTFETATHMSQHKLEPVYIRQSSSLDLDYSVQRFLPGDYNYLDPNYMPTTWMFQFLYDHGNDVDQSGRQSDDHGDE